MADNAIIRLSPNPKGFATTPDELKLEDFSSVLPTQHSFEYYEDEALGLFIGVWDTDDMVEVAVPYAVDEFMWLIEGEAKIKNCATGNIEKAKAGEAFIIPRGYRCQWHQTGYLRKFYVTYANPDDVIEQAPTHEGIIVLPVDSKLTTMTTPAPFHVTTGAVARDHVCYRNASGTFLAGRWASAAFVSSSQQFPYNEVAVVQSGSITLVDAQGLEHVFNQGDAFFIPQGVVCSAKSSQQVSLFFAIIQAS